MKEKIKEKKLIIALIIVVILAGSLIVVKLLTKEEKIIINDKEGVVSNKEVSNISFSNIEYYYDGTITTVFMNITNNNEQTVVLGDFIANIYDKDGNFIEKFEPTTAYELKQDETMELEFNCPKDLSSAYKMDIELPNLTFLESSDVEFVE